MRDAHRRRLAGAVGAAEAEHRAGRDREADPVEHVVVAEALVQPVELEHRSSRPSSIADRHRIGRPLLAPGRPRAVSSGHEPRTIRRSRPQGVGLDGLRSAAAGCRACELWEPATQTVFGEGPETARIVFVGEQPGDQEDRTASRSSARPGGCSTGRWPTPASTAGTPTSPTRSSTSGSRRRASGGSTRRPARSTCAPAGPGWRRSSRCSSPRSSSASGATAAKALISPSFRITKDRGQLLPWTPPGAPPSRRRAPEADDDEPDEDAPAQTWMLATTHPSAILRTPDEGRAAAYDALVADLRWSPHALA